MILKRKLYQKMLDWKQHRYERTALMIEGARRVGKSFLVKQFIDENYRSAIYIDFAHTTKEIIDLIEQESADLSLFYGKLSVIMGVRLYEKESAIVFDEVQLCPKARQLVKYMVEDGRYDVIETGSLLTLKQNVSDIVIPSEEEHLTMHPLDFEEFLWANDDTVTMPMIQEAYEKKQPLGQSVHRKIIRDFRQYILIGGMPQSITSYFEKKDYEMADYAKQNILRLYRDDVSKFAKGYEYKVLNIFDGIPGQLSKKEKKYSLSAIEKNARKREYEEAFVWLNEAKIINTCFNATDPNVGLSLSMDNTTEKCYMADTGLLVSHCFHDRDFMENDLYRAILLDKLGINEGMLIENIVAQMLTGSGHNLFFYSRNDSKTRKNSIEIDFLIRQGNKICPIEVKSSNYKKHRSLDAFYTKFKDHIGTRYILYDKDIMITDDIVHLPVYMGMLL